MSSKKALFIEALLKTSRLIVCTAAMIIIAPSSRASEPDEIAGIPVVENSGQIMLQGRNFSLWGITTLACDQQCWHGNTPWPCGEHATMALKHFIEGRPIACRTADEPAGRMTAQCYRQRGESKQDIARLLVRHGWAMDNGNVSGGLYAEDQENAQEKGRGIWTSRFQTPEDWINGIQRYVEYEMAPSANAPHRPQTPPAPPPATENREQPPPPQPPPPQPPVAAPGP